MDYKIEQKESGGKGMFFVEEDGSIVGHLLYSMQEDGIMSLDHTEVDPKMSGKGLASKLVKHSVDFAREKNYKIHPRCTYAAMQFERHGEYKEVQVNQE